MKSESAAVSSRKKSLFSLPQFSSRRILDNEETDQRKFFIAIQEGNEEIAKSLLGKVDLDAVDQNGYNALHIATTADKDKMVAFLLQSGAKVDSKTKDHEQKIAEENLGQTALELAFTRGNPKTIKLLVEARADLERVTHGQKNALTSVAVLYVNASSKNKGPFKEATIAVLDRMEPDAVLKSLEYLVKERPKAAEFLISTIREYAKSGIVHQDPETLVKKYVEKFNPEQQEKFNKIASAFKADKLLGGSNKKSAAVTDIQIHDGSPSSSPSSNEQTRGCLQSLKAFLGITQGPVKG